jgi:hypothetical protein
MKPTLGLILLIVAGAVVDGQEPASSRLKARFDAAVRAIASTATLEPVSLPADRTYEYQRWRYQQKTVSVRFFIPASAVEAKRLLSQLLERPVPARGVSGFGDEAWVFAPSDPQGDRTLVFRRGRVVLEVVAKGEEELQRCSKSFLREVNQFLAQELAADQK